MLSLPNLVSIDLSDNAFGGRSAEPMYVHVESYLPVASLYSHLRAKGSSSFHRTLVCKS